MSSSNHVMHVDSTLQFSDDEPLPADIQNVVSISGVPECDAVAASESVDNFGVVIRLRAPPLSEDARRSPIDLVTVLDISGSMSRASKLDVVKRAVSFVIDHMGPSDRLSIVSFDTCALRVLPLRRMTEQGRADAKRVVDSLSAVGKSTDIVKGLTMGVQVLEERRHRNHIESILFLSDGKDNCDINLNARRPSDYLPASISNGHQSIPVYAFGFGHDHDPLVMHAIADSSGGTFSFIESYESVQDAFARCIGGLLSIVVREVRLMLRSSSDGVDIKSIPSGKHASKISDRGSSGTVTVGDLYADEEKEFLVNVSVPVYANDDEDVANERRTALLDITCSYVDVLSTKRVQIESVEIRRPGVPLPSDVRLKLEVDRQRNRLDAAEGLAEAQRVAETGDLRAARAILSEKISSVRASVSGQAGDGLSLQLETAMKETEEKMGCKGTYEKSGRAYALSSISAHSNQRATTSGSMSASNDVYVTPNMAYMVNKSQGIIKIEDAKMED